MSLTTIKSFCKACGNTVVHQRWGGCGQKDFCSLVCIKEHGFRTASLLVSEDKVEVPTPESILIRYHHLGGLTIAKMVTFMSCYGDKTESSAREDIEIALGRGSITLDRNMALVLTDPPAQLLPEQL